jgi:pyruvate kinase
MTARRAKIVCTIGPACDSDDQLEQLIQAGMDVARLNFSHGTHAEHKSRYEAIRRASEKCAKPVAILQDLCGPKIRVGTIINSPRIIEDNTEVFLTEDREPISEDHLPIQYEGLVEDVRVGDQILLDDGRVVLMVQSIAEDRVLALVKQGGQIRNKVGVHLPSRRVRLSALTEKDKADLSFGLSLGVDYVALSFVRSADDIRLVKEICQVWGQPLPVVAKIETPEAVENINSIAEISDGVMVARGDLGVEFPPERVPVIQKQVMLTAKEHNCPVIVATEMLHSMVSSTRPTRAEASDVAHAVYDGTDGVMLSGETATGEHPILACRMMARIVSEAEKSTFYEPQAKKQTASTGVVEAVARNAVGIAHELGARLIVAFTESGHTARLVSKARPSMPIVAFSPSERTRRKLAMYWGVIPSKIEPTLDIDSLVDLASGHLLARGLASPGDHCVVVFGAPLGVRGSTNSIRVRVVG